MDILDIIKGRRSIRKYQDKKIAKETMNKIISAGNYAPSAGNAQDYEFLIIENREIMEHINEIHPHAKAILSADKAIIVLGNLNKEKFKGFWVQDCSAAVENILLAAHAYGIGTVWCGIYPNEERVKGFKDLFNLPENIIPFALIPMGYPDEEVLDKVRLYTNNVFYNQYNNEG